MPQEGAGLEPGSTSINLHSAHSAMPPDLPALAEHSQLLVDLGTSDDAVRGTTVGAYFPLYVPFAEAVAAFASQIQDHAMEAEATFGRPLPPCPGHTPPDRQRHRWHRSLGVSHLSRPPPRARPPRAADLTQFRAPGAVRQRRSPVPAEPIGDIDCGGLLVQFPR
ncbi:hypothetical protein [Streptomyces coerulescens]|uniref:Uncharacterized protein n=1 Tax=Streptomyces coerulescens TaxID=29304 RepID=A0ABW0D001_STRCD